MKESILNFIDYGYEVAVLQTLKPQEILQKLENEIFLTISAGGGIVRNDNDDFLMIYRNGFWDLPKGKLDEGESIEEAAVREVEEECNVSCNILNPHPIMSYHLYEHKGQMVFKKTYWFEMNAKQNNRLVPQLEEGITEVGFYSKSDLEEKLKTSFPNLQDLMERYFAKSKIG